MFTEQKKSWWRTPSSKSVLRRALSSDFPCWVPSSPPRLILHLIIITSHVYMFISSYVVVVAVQSLGHVWLFVTQWTAAHQASLFLTISQNLSKFMFIESERPSNHLIPCHPLLLCLRSFPASGSFPVTQLFTSGGQSIGVSASVLPLSVQGWFSLGLTSLNPLLSKGLSRILSSTTAWKHQFFRAQPPCKTMALTIWTFVGKVKPFRFNMLSRFVLAFFSRSKCLPISWLQFDVR